MADGYSKEEIEKMVEKAVEKSINGILMVAITETVHCAVTKAMKEYSHECLFDLNPKEIEAVQTMVDVMKSSGHGDIIKGVEEIRDNHNFIAGMRKKCEKMSDTVAQTLVKTVVALILVAIGVGAGVMVVKNSGAQIPGQ